MSIPPMAPVPSALLPLAPTPCANIIGRRPMIIASDVMRIGRKRAAAASMAASIIVMPPCRLVTANSVIKIAFLAKRPIA